MVQVATCVDEEQYRLFEQATAALGITPSDALRMFIFAFNEHGGFPYEVIPAVEAFETEEEATCFAASLAIEMLDAER